MSTSKSTNEKKKKSGNKSMFDEGIRMKKLNNILKTEIDEENFLKNRKSCLFYVSNFFEYLLF